MKLSVWTTLLLLGGAALLGCDKPEEGLVVCETDESVNSVEQFHRWFSPSVQSFQLSTARAQNVPLPDGSVVFVPAQAFVRPDGSVVADVVELRVQSLIQPVDMLLSGLPTQSYLRPLESGGQARLTAWLNGVPLRLRPGRSLTLTFPRLPNAALTGMVQMTGFPVTGNTLTWRFDTARVVLDGIPGGQQYFQTQVRTDTLGWFSVGKLWTSNPSDTTLLRADVGGDPTARVYVLPTQRNGVFMMKWNAQTRLMELYGVPAGSDVKVFVLRTQAGKLLVGAEHTPVRRGNVFRLPLQQMAPQVAADYIRRF
jgi:hypothetical protein